MDVRNGDILSLVSLPNFNINQRITIKDKSLLIKLPKAYMNLDQFLRHLQWL